MSQRLSKICIDSDLEENNIYEIDNYKNNVNNENNKNNKIILFFNELFYDLYFKYTDIKFYFECLDDDEKMKIITTIIILFICISSFIMYLYLF
jgi:hypothetical protein